MKVHRLHSWDLSAAEAIALQHELAEQVNVTVPLGRCELIAGADVSYNRYSDVIYAGVVVWRAADNTVVERVSAVTETHFPYIPGLLSFREAPALVEAFARVTSQPDVVMLDGQGIAHPRRMGIASHVGLWLQVPTVGCAKSRLYGKFEPPAPEAGSTSPLLAGKQVVGEVVRTKDRVNPVFASPGHLIDTPGAVRAVLAGVRGYRLPEPTRLAHLYVNEERRKGLG
ncbi:MAG TPA: deoxyribonuclease V [Gemmataceae bacterium]|jgi:deoxyribonuclease V